MIERVRHPDLRLQRGRRRPGRQRPVAGRADRGPARRGRPAARRRPVVQPLASTASPAARPTAALTDGRDALLAVGMNGEPLPVEHGFPVRMVVPGLYGYVSATKWVIDLELTTFADFDAYWMPRGWSRAGADQDASRIDTPARRRAAAAPGTVDGGRRGLGPAPGDLRGRGAGRRRPVAAGDAGRGGRRSTPGGSGRWQWDGDRRASTRCGSAPPTTPARPRPSSRRRRRPDGATGWHTVQVDDGKREPHSGPTRTQVAHTVACMSTERLCRTVEHARGSPGDRVSRVCCR